jgi:cytochrome bd ubiquinol oxidase subunit I
VLSFELGLLWPEFMRHAGPLVGMPFSLEGFAFFLEAIFLGLYLYGWDRLSPRVHLLTGVGVAACGLLSAIFVTAVNAWMNEPAGFEFVDGEFTHIDPRAAMFNNAFFNQALHMSLAAYAAVAIAVMGIHAWALRRDPDSPVHREAFRLALVLALVAVPAQIISGDLSSKHIAEHQPVKLAAAESLFETQRAAPLAIGGLPDLDTQELRYALEVPGALSFLAFADFDAEVQGLDQVPRELWPPVPIVHVAFQIMVACGFAMLGLVAFGGLTWLAAARFGRGLPPWRRPGYLKLALLATPLGMIAIEAGWTVTEVGRQPWIVVGTMKTADAVTPMPQLVVPLLGFTLLYLFLGVVVLVLLKNHVLASGPRTPAQESTEGAGESDR